MMDISSVLALLGLKGATDHDVELPNESGRVDPRIKRYQAPHLSPADAMQQAGEGYRQLNDRLSQLKAQYPGR